MIDTCKLIIPDRSDHLIILQEWYIPYYLYHHMFISMCGGYHLYHVFFLKLTSLHITNWYIKLRCQNGFLRMICCRRFVLEKKKYEIGIYTTWSKRVYDNKKSVMVLWWCTCVWIFPTRWVHDEFYPLADSNTQLNGYVYQTLMLSRTDSRGGRIQH